MGDETFSAKLAAEARQNRAVTSAFSAKRTAELVGVTYRQLDYWARTDLVRPSVREARGSGSRRRYSLEDVHRLTIVRLLLDLGLGLPGIRNVSDALERSGDDGYLVIGRTAVSVTTDLATLLEAIRSENLVHVVSLDAVRRDVTAAVATATAAA